VDVWPFPGEWEAWGLAREQLADGLLAVCEDALELRADEPGMGEIAEGGEGEDVGGFVGHLDAAVAEVMELVLVMPEGIGTDALLVDEALAFFDEGDF
jgi:hypothetical protein